MKFVSLIRAYFSGFFGLKWPMSNVLSYWEVTFVFTWRNNWYDILNAFINDLSDDLKTNAWLFADDVSLFSVADHMNLSATNLSGDLSKLNARANQWKMTFNPEPNKQAQKVIFSRKIKRHHTLHWTSKTLRRLSGSTFVNTFKTCFKK